MNFYGIKRVIFIFDRVITRPMMTSLSANRQVDLNYLSNYHERCNDINTPHHERRGVESFVRR